VAGRSAVVGRGAGELIQLGQGCLVLAAPGGLLGSNDVGERGDTHLHVPDAAAQRPCRQLVVAALEGGGTDGEVQLAVGGLQVEYPLSGQRLGRRAERQSVERPLGADARVQLAQRRSEAVQVLPGGRRGDVHVAGGPGSAVHARGKATDHHVLHAVALQDGQDRLRIERT
jgi:hypothetical protein